MAIENNTQDIIQNLLACEEGRNNISTRPFSSSISMVPSMLKNLSPKSFTPRVVSIGPLHHEDENVKEMEGLKRIYLHDLLLRVNASIDQIRARYIGMRPYSDVQLAKMMLIDGCFIIEVCKKHSTKTNSVNPLLARPVYMPRLVAGGKPDSILFPTRIPYCTRSLFTIFNNPHAAQELVKVGVSFKPYLDERWPLAMKLEWSRFGCFSWVCGMPVVIKMPAVCFSHFYELLVRNLIAYEQTYDVGKYISSHALAMDILIDGQEDIAKLVESKVIVNIMGSNKEAADMINSLVKEVPMTDFFYADELTQLVRNHEGYWPKHIAWLRRKYFKSPWSVITLFAGMILFGLTVVQTICSIKH
ncbi:hypothetical protein CTI12_AA512930 [Artemisia annua]|uniref:Uncharacterized protein n=1 Tax=Artemisia annua TaxID=35608 RepID=A0A2U1LAI1_ARTAN|nr:hypothetical protein CTI12_AA512930 [Artemisia annua]